MPIIIGHYSSLLCISPAWGRSWVFISLGRRQREMRGRDAGAIGKAETNDTSSGEGHLDCSGAKTLPRWLLLKRALSKYLSFLPARPPVELPSPTIYWIESARSDKITFLMPAKKKSQTVDNSREKDLKKLIVLWFFFFCILIRKSFDFSLGKWRHKEGAGKRISSWAPAVSAARRPREQSHFGLVPKKWWLSSLLSARLLLVGLCATQ